MSPQPVIIANAPALYPSVIRQGSGPQTAGPDPRAQALAEALASLHEPARTVRTPTALAADLLAEALLQRRYGPTAPGAAPIPGSSIPAAPISAGMAPGRTLTPGGAPAYAPQGLPGPLQVAPVPQATPLPSPSPGAPAPSAPTGTASAAPAASSSPKSQSDYPGPAAGAAMAAAYGQGDPRQLPSARGPQVTPPPPGVLNTAWAAIQRGADPAKVRARLAAHGYDPGAL